MTLQRKRRGKGGQRPRTSQQSTLDEEEEEEVAPSRQKPAKGQRKLRKCRVTREFRQREREVQALLERVQLSDRDGGATADTEVLFFCGECGEESPLGERGAPTEGERIEEESEAEGEEAEHADAESDSSTGYGGAGVKASTNAQTTYIQIEELEQLANLGSTQAVTVYQRRQRHVYTDAELLCRFAKQLPLHLRHLAEAAGWPISGVDRRLLAMLQRYWLEAHAANRQLSAAFIEELLRPVRAELHPAVGRFRSYCNAAAYRFHPVFCDAAAEVVEIPTRQLLKLQLCELRFSDHPALGEEHRLANRLDEMYEEHTERRRSKLSERLAAQLKTERRILEQLLQHATDEKSAAAENAKRLAQQERAVRELRVQLYAAEAHSRQLLQDILDAWRQLKQLRQTQEYQCTRFKLRLHIGEPTPAAHWTQRYETDLKELYRELLETYYHAKRQWRNGGEGEATEKPQRPHLKLVAAELMEQLTLSLGAPGEPQVRVSRVSAEACYTPAPNYQRQSFYMRLYCDSEFVGETRTYRLEPDCRLVMHEAIGIVLQRRVPKQLRIALYEKHKLSPPSKVTNIMLPLPGSCSAAESDEPPLQQLSFTSHKQPLAGRLLVRCLCVEQSAGTAYMGASVAVEVKRSRRRLERFASSSEAETETESPSKGLATSDTCTFEETLVQFCSTTELRQNARLCLLRSRHQQSDARTRDLRFIPALAHELPGALEHLDGGRATAGEESALIELGNWMDPIDVQKHAGKKRIRALYERLRGHCARLQKTREFSEDLLTGDEPASWSSFFRLLGLLFHPSRPLGPARQLEDRPAGSGPPSLNLCDSGCQSQALRIVLMVVRATGVPVRDQRQLDASPMEAQPRSGPSSTPFKSPALKYSNVRPFVVLSYKDRLCRSVTAEGSTPTWNEQLILHLSSSDLSDLRDDLKLSLYDEVVEQQPNGGDDAAAPADIYQRVQCNWLGEYRVPIGGLLASAKLEGAFELQTPKVLLGYRWPALDSLGGQMDPVSLNMEPHYPEIRETVHLWCYLSCEPSVLLPQLKTACLECAETQAVRQHLQEWSILAQELQPARYLPPLVCTAEGKRVCVTRLLQAVPLAIDSSENLLASACRYVALLAVLPAQQAQHVSAAGLRGIWLNNQWLLEAGCGAPKDLGVLLYNYLLTLGLKCWLVLGVACPWGECAYVLYRGGEEDTSVESLWLADPCTGKRYAQRDVCCPLQRVHCVVSPDNIYLNIQREQRVAMTSFRLQDTACWLPAFSKRQPAPTDGVQQLGYVYRPANNTLELRRHIERKIMKKISAWRPMRKTVWHRGFQPRLLAILEQLERAVTFNRAGSGLTETRYAKQLAAEFPQYKLHGLTLNFAYTNLSAVSERVKATGLHLHSDPKVQFSVAVHVHAYAQNVLSIWIFLLASVPFL